MPASKTAPKTARKTKAKATPKKATAPSYDVKLSSVHVNVATKRNTSPDKAAKTNRGRMRANFDKVCELSPNVKDHKESANDGKAWPVFVSRELADYLEGVTKEGDAA